jgi:hypothetical protein
VRKLGLSKCVKTKENQQLVSERMELEAKSVGAIAVAGKPIGQKIALKFLDAVLTLSAIIVPGKDALSSTRAVGNNEADVGAQRTHFDLNHDPAFSLPAFGPMPKAIENPERVFWVRAYLRWVRLSQRSILCLKTELEAIPMA